MRPKVLTRLAAMALTAALCLLPAVAEARPCGRVLFFSYGDRFEGIASVRGDGTDRRHISRAPYASFLLSPDASQIAFHHYDESQGRTDVWVMGSNGTGYRNVTKTPSQSEVVYSWAPGSRRLAIERYNDSGIPTIFLLNVRTGRVVRVIDGYEPAVAPGGKKIAFAAPSPDLLDSTWDIYTIRLADGHTRRVTQDPRSDDTSPRWSPTGAWLAFNRYPLGQMNQNEGPYSDIWRVRPSGTAERNLTNHQDDYNGVSVAVWSPNGKWIAYNTEWDEGGAVHIMRADGSRDRALTRDFYNWSRDPTWSPRGHRVAYERSGSESTDIWSFDLRNRTKTRLTPTRTASESRPMWASCRP